MFKKSSFVIFMLILMLGLAGCTEPEASTIQIDGSNNGNVLVLADGNQVVLTANVVDQRGEVFPVNTDEITWQVSNPAAGTIDSTTGGTITLTALTQDDVTLVVRHGEIEITHTVMVFGESPQAVVFSENFEAFSTGTPNSSSTLTFNGDAEVVTGSKGQGANALKLRVTEPGGNKTNAELSIDFGSSLKNHKVSFLINKPSGVGTANVHLLGTGASSGFQLTNGNAVRYRTTEGSVSSDTEIGNVPVGEWIRIEIEFDDNTGTYSFYQGEGGARTVIGRNIKYTKGDDGITGFRVVHQGNANTDIFIDDIIVTDLVLQDIGF